MAIKTPTINSVIRMTEFDLLRTSITQGNMYMCLDSQNLYYDETNSRRVKYAYTSVKTVNDLFYNLTPSPGTTYYCWEDNSLWLWMNKWISIWSDSTYPSAYAYDSINPSQTNTGKLNTIYINDDPYSPADSNGLLKDGSVVVRDRQRIIKGKIYIEDNNDNLTISSFLGGGIRFLPNGQADSDGELLIGDEGKSYFRTELHLLNNEAYIDYSEDPESDPSEYKNSDHIYEIFHSGNLDVSAIKVLKPLDIYNKLLDKSLPEVFDFNVRYLNGNLATDFAFAKHKHKSTDISDFNEASRNQSEVKIKEIFNTMTGEGIYISYMSNTSSFKMSANNFNLTFAGGVSGTAEIRHLSDTTINLDVDPSKHVHKNYVEKLDNLQDQINNITSVDPTAYYTKTEMNTKLSQLAGTEEPTIGKPLLVNTDLKLPGTSLKADQLSDLKNISFTGDITGEINTDFSSDTIITLNTDNIISNIPQSGKVLKLDSDLNLPANAISASKLNHDINIRMIGEVNGNSILDTSLNEISINTTLTPNDNIIQSKDIGVRVAGLDSNGKIPSSQLPSSEISLSPQGYWDPNDGAPSSNPLEGQFWIANNNGIFNNYNFKINDWCLYYNSEWQYLSVNSNVISVNNKTGLVNLTADDVNAISKNYIDYDLGSTIPVNKVVITSQEGIIEGASVSKLSRSFNITSIENSLISIDEGSGVISTDGSKDIQLNLKISETGYTDLKSKIGFNILNNNVLKEYKPNLNFGNGLKITSEDNTLNIDVISNNDFNILYYNYSDDITDLINIIDSLYDDRSGKPIMLIYKDNDAKVYNFIIDKNVDDRNSDNVVNIVSINSYNEYSTDNYTIDNLINYTMHIIFNSDEEASIKNITLDKSSIENNTFLNVNVKDNATAFIPTKNAQPTSKQYVDNLFSKRAFITAIGDGSKKQYTINHNLNSNNIIVQFRKTSNMEQCYIDNVIVDENNIKINSQNILTEKEITVYVWAM